MPGPGSNRPAAGLRYPLARLVVAAAIAALLQACAARPPAPPPAVPVPPPEAPAAPAPALDGRLQVDAHEYPWSALGRLNLAGLGFCNGILIDAETVLTQARCLYNARDGRWWQPQELHFIAAYQSDDFLADAPVSNFTVAPGFNPAGGASLANLASNWAAVTLGQPIGRQTGWLGLEWDSDALKTAAARGEAAYLRAGYRRDWAHAVSLHFGCAPERADVAGLCGATPSEQGLPAFVLSGGELRVLADFFLRSPRQAGTLARLTAGAVADNRLGQATAPAAGSPVRAAPRDTAARFLRGLGYDVDGAGLEAAAAAFRRARGLLSGGIDAALLTALVDAARRGGG